MTPPRWLADRRLWLALGLLAALGLAHGLGLTGQLSLESLSRHRAVLAGFVAAHLLPAALLYAAGYAVVVALSIPGAVFLTLAGGFLFGAALGTALTVAGATVGATALFLLARRILGADALDRLGPRAQALGQAIRRNAASYLLVLRLVPIFPFFLVNLVPAFVGVRLGTYVATTAIGILPGTAVFSLAGAGLEEVLASGAGFEPGSVLSPRILAALVGLAALSLLAIPLRARFARR